jgi:hypothetical protein
MTSTCPARPCCSLFLTTAQESKSAQLQSEGRQVVDGLEGAKYDAVVRGSLVYSPDGQLVAYAARKNAKMFVVVDGRCFGKMAGTTRLELATSAVTVMRFSVTD